MSQDILHSCHCRLTWVEEVGKLFSVQFPIAILISNFEPQGGECTWWSITHQLKHTHSTVTASRTSAIVSHTGHEQTSFFMEFYLYKYPHSLTQPPPHTVTPSPPLISIQHILICQSAVMVIDLIVVCKEGRKIHHIT